MNEELDKEEAKVPIIGEFKPKRKFLNFISSVNGMKVRFIRDIAFLKGEKISGTLEGVVFKITICDEGTINFEEVDTNVTDKAQRKRLIDDIDDMSVRGYAQKFVIGGIQFADKDGSLCYLEVENQKPIDKLKSIFDVVEVAEKEETKLSDRGLSLLDSLFGTDDSVETTEKDMKVIIDECESPSDPNEALKSAGKSYLEEQFQKMNEDKVIELKSRIIEKQEDINKYKREISTLETRLKQSSEQFGILETRLESMYGGEEPNNYVFFISEEQKNETGVDETSRGIVDKIADVMKLKKDVLFDFLTEGFYKIKIAPKDNFTENVKIKDRDIIEKVSLIDPVGKISMTGNGEFEYRGELTWHKLVDKMIRKGFEQEPEFDKLCNSNSYDSSVLNKDKDKEINLGGIVLKTDEGFVDMGNGVIGVLPSKPTPKFKKGDKVVFVGPVGNKLGLVNGDVYNYYRSIDDGVEITKEDVNTNISKSIVLQTQNDIMLESEYLLSIKLKTKKLKSYKEPTTLVVMGSLDHNENNDFSIQDDYDGFHIYINGKKVKRKYSYECDGFVSIMTIDEFKLFLKNSDFDGEDNGGCDSFLLPNFVGDIELGVKLEDGTYTTNFDISDYIRHQDFGGLETEDVFLNFPEGTVVVDMENHQIPTQIIRDMKLDIILD